MIDCLQGWFIIIEKEIHVVNYRLHKDKKTTVETNGTVKTIVCIGLSIPFDGISDNKVNDDDRYYHQ